MKQLISDELRAKVVRASGKRAAWLMDRHPDGEHVALLQADERAVVAQLSSGAIPWAPDGAAALCWHRNGSEVIAIANHPEDAEHEQTVDRWTWPGRELIASWPLYMPGWCDDLVVSPMGSVAAVTWLEQDAAGFFVLRLDAPSGEECQSEGADYEHRDGNLLVGPVFSPDGRYLVASCTLWSWWAPHGDPETPSPGGDFQVGHVVVFDVQTLRYVEERIHANVPQAWRPAGAGADIEAEIMGPPRFVDAQRFEVRLPNGETRSFDLKTMRPQ